MHQIDAEAPPPVVDSDSSYLTSPTTTLSTKYTQLSHSGDSDPLSPNPLFFQSEKVLTYQNVICTAINEVQWAWVLHNRIPTIHAPQIHPLKEWKIHRPWHFHRKLRVSHEVFIQLVEKICHHPIFLTSSHQDSDSNGMHLPDSLLPREQLPVWLQLAIFLNAAGHYGNAATSQDMAEYYLVFVNRSGLTHGWGTFFNGSTPHFRGVLTCGASVLNK